MAYVSIDRDNTNHDLFGLKAWVQSIREGMQRRRVYERTINELERLSNRDLADLGISRLMIRDIAREAAYGK